ncbi:aminodeoxychorismate lyase [Georgenia alba]|uniref:Aminodeoxychorismate lyase n=1 Tax=Georgenia alba TaxID=2233858 RepID=A0ABW2Q7T7_9MICO
MSQPVLVRIDPVTPLPPGTPAPAGRLRLADVTAPAVTVLDLGITRGDGVFETVGVVGGRPQALQAHLRRLQRSATMLDLPELDLGAVEDAVRLAIERHDPGPFLLVKVVLTRGIEGGDGTPTAWAHAFEGSGSLDGSGRGIKVVRLDRGYRSDVAQTSPWLLQGAKTVSYAVNMAALREAARRGADDVIFVSSDGYVLEAPRSTVVLRRGEVFITPRTDIGILAGTTQDDLFSILTETGRTTEYRLVRQEELDEADGLWLVSSGQQISPVVELDGRPLPRYPELDAELLERLRARTA